MEVFMISLMDEYLETQEIRLVVAQDAKTATMWAKAKNPNCTNFKIKKIKDLNYTGTPSKNVGCKSLYFEWVRPIL